MGLKSYPNSISEKIRAAMKDAMANDTPRRTVKDWAESYGIRTQLAHRLGVQVGYRFARPPIQEPPAFIKLGARYSSSHGLLPVGLVPSSAWVKGGYKAGTRARLNVDETTGRITFDRV